MMLSQLFKKVSLVALLSVPVAACGGVEGEDGDTSGDAIVFRQLCTEDYCSGSLAGTNYSLDKTSPTASYNNSSYPGSYVYDVTGLTAGKKVSIGATWGEALPNTKEACPFALIAADVYVPVNGTWTKLFSKSAGATWTEPSCDPNDSQCLDFGAGCNINLDLGSFNAPGGWFQFSSIRVVAKAAANAIFFNVPKKVEITAFEPADLPVPQ